MNSNTLPILLAATAGLGALPFHFGAALLLLLTAGLGAIIRLDYAHRYRGLPVPRRPRAVPARPVFRAPPLASEPNRLAA